MKETPFFFPTDGGQLFGVFHEAPPSARPSIVLCPPFLEEKLWAHRVLVSAARTLAQEGYPVLRFDCRGSGDSAGAFSSTTLETVQADVRSAIEQVRVLADRQTVSLIGVRFGAAIASLVAEEMPDVRELVLWAPILDGARYMQELLRGNLSTQLAAYKTIRYDRAALVAQMEQGQTVNIDGYELSHAMYTQCSAVTLTSRIPSYAGPLPRRASRAVRGRPGGQGSRELRLVVRAGDVRTGAGGSVLEGAARVLRRGPIG